MNECTVKYRDWERLTILLVASLQQSRGENRSHPPQLATEPRDDLLALNARKRVAINRKASRKSSLCGERDSAPKFYFIAIKSRGTIIL